MNCKGEWSVSIGNRSFLNIYVNQSNQFQISFLPLFATQFHSHSVNNQIQRQLKPNLILKKDSSKSRNGVYAQNLGYSMVGVFGKGIRYRNGAARAGAVYILRTSSSCVFHKDIRCAIECVMGGGGRNARLKPFGAGVVFILAGRFAG